MQDQPQDGRQAWEPREIRVARHVGELRAALGELCDAPPWPARELLTAFRLMAGMAELPKTCQKPACRRARQCRATDIEAGAACGRRFSAAQERDYQNMALGVLIAWRAQCARASAEAAALARWSGADAAGAPLSPRRRPRKAKP